MRRFGCAGNSRQNQARSETAAWARISRAPRVSLGEPTVSRPSAGIPRPAWISTGRRRSSASATRSATAGTDEGEALRARVQLDPAGAGVQRPLGLGDGALVRVDAAERGQSAARVGRRGEHSIVRRPVAVGLGHREDDPAGVGTLEPGEQLGRRLLVAVGVVGTDMGVGVEELERAGGAEQRLPPRPGDLIERIGGHRRDRVREAHRPTAAAIRSTICSSSCGEVAKLSLAKPAPPLPNCGPGLSATRPRSRKAAAGSSPSSSARQSSQAR